MTARENWNEFVKAQESFHRHSLMRLGLSPSEIEEIVKRRPVPEMPPWMMKGGDKGEEQKDDAKGKDGDGDDCSDDG